MRYRADNPVRISKPVRASKVTESWFSDSDSTGR
jgi:hypothetical protein